MRTLNALASGYEHFTWFNAIPGFNRVDHELASTLGDSYWAGTQVQTVRHVLLALIMVVVVVLIARAAGRKFSNPDKYLIPEAKPNARNLMEIVLDAIYNLAVDGMGEKWARRSLPLIGTVTMYVFFSNIMGLVPGFSPPTENLNATLAPALVVVVMTHYYGVKEHGVGSYLKHFLGPVWYIAPLYLMIEIVGHLFRVVSLAFRLMGNMIGDHKVITSFLALTVVSFVFPVPFWFLGLVVCTMQTLVFALLTVIYIQLAVAHGEEH
jgi:F-type H+-transporting ATPase subunit a